MEPAHEHQKISKVYPCFRMLRLKVEVLLVDREGRIVLMRTMQFSRFFEKLHGVGLCHIIQWSASLFAAT